MNLERVLDNWEEYERRKSSQPDIFLTSESWEVDFLLRKVLTHFPYFDAERVRRAIMLCGSRLGVAAARRELVECLLTRLGLVPVDITNHPYDHSSNS